MKRTLLLMGASGGIGRAILKPLCQAGYQLALHYNGDFEQLTKAVEELNPANKIALFKADLNNETDIAEMVESVQTEFGSIDILVNNAGVSQSGISWKQDLEGWDRSLAINLTGPFLTMKHVIPGMKKQGWGRIINVSSVVAQWGVPGTVAYSAAKSGVIGMSRTIAAELAQAGITVNTLAYGYMDAGMLHDLTDEMREAIQKVIPMQKFGDPMNIARAILFLADEQVDYITGQVININGGLAG
ncbi:MAG: 3-oxoacyl-ACP reductase FabG [Bacteroidota bacterium]|nr:3-oxoacyl-ACP reductase FabG [Bacteroidota bacterium]